MLQPRVIPCLLLKGRGLVKTCRFRDPKYVGDPINAVRIFNDKMVDELAFLDITATPEGRGPSFEVISDVASECFMPLLYGGGIRSLDDAERMFNAGVEKIAVNSHAGERPRFIRELASQFGSQSIVVSIDVKRSPFGKHKVHTFCGRTNTKHDPVDYARRMEDMGAGELLITSIDRDGTQQGYDLPLITKVAASVSIPLIACGGAGSIDDFRRALHETGASAVAAGSVFVFHGKHRAVLISYPKRDELNDCFARAA